MREIHSDDTIVVLDISEDLPAHPEKDWQIVPGRDIDTVYIHHTAGGTTRGPAGPAATARYCIDHRGWPGIPYHLFVPYEPIVDAGRLVVYQCQLFDAWTWHTGRGHNEHGIGVACQGHFESRHAPGQAPLAGPSGRQLRALGAVWGWLRSWYPGLRLSCHAWAKGAEKPACPGDVLESWCRARQ